MGRADDGQGRQLAAHVAGDADGRDALVAFVAAGEVLLLALRLDLRARVAASAMLLAVTCSNCMVSMRALRSASPISPSSALPIAATCSAKVVPGCTT